MFARTILTFAQRAGIDPRACHWKLSPVQKVMVENCATTLAIVETKTIEEEVQLAAASDMTLCGVNVVTDLKMPEDIIELCYGREVIGRITNLSLPVGYR